MNYCTAVFTLLCVIQQLMSQHVTIASQSPGNVKGGGCSNLPCENPRQGCKANNTTCGHPGTGCVEFECRYHEECTVNHACIEGKCKNLCPVCGEHAVCRSRHYNCLPSCVCLEGFSGNPFLGCHRIQKVFYPEVKNGSSFNNAIENCRSRGMRLATPQDEGEYNALVTAVKRSFAQHNVTHAGVWISASDFYKTGSYVWMTTGSPVNFKPWGPGQPDHLIVGSEVAHCVTIWVGKNDLMYDDCCSSKFLYVCET